MAQPESRARRIWVLVQGLGILISMYAKIFSTRMKCRHLGSQLSCLLPQNISVLISYTLVNIQWPASKLVMCNTDRRKGIGLKARHVLGLKLMKTQSRHFLIRLILSAKMVPSSL